MRIFEPSTYFYNYNKKPLLFDIEGIKCKIFYKNFIKSVLGKGFLDKFSVTSS